MSMLSAQCDELRERAKELCNLAPDPAVPYLVPSTKETIALAMRSAASEMEDAADTILSLRDRAQELQAENAKLRELAQNLRRVIPADVVGVVIGANTDHPSYYKFDKAFRELGVVVD